MNNELTMIELFSGIGAQERSLRQFGIPYKIINTCDCDANAVLSYAAMRFDIKEEVKKFNFPSVDEMITSLQNKNIGFDFAKRKHTINRRTPIEKLKRYYISDILIHNLGDISKVQELPYADVVTYSSPCQSFSLAGKLGGAMKTCKVCGNKWNIDFSNPNYNYNCPSCGSTSLESTTSGLLQEVQRLLSISYNNHTLPKYLLLENVKNLVGKKFKPQFDDWIKWLDSIGYDTTYSILDSKQFGLPQSRERVFAVSIRKDINNHMFTMPEGFQLQTRVKDILEQSVDEKYYLSKEVTERYKKDIEEKIIIPLKRGYSIEVQQQENMSSNIEVLGNYSKSNYNATQIISKNGVAPTVRENHGQVTAILEPIVVASRGRDPINPSNRKPGCKLEQRLEANANGYTNSITTVQKDNYIFEPIMCKEKYNEVGINWRIRKLTPRECWRLMGFDDNDFDMAAQYVCDSSLYKQAGNSICTCCLIAIFYSLLFNDHSTNYKKFLIDYHT